MAIASSVDRARQVTPATYAGLFMVTLATLMYEIVLTRIFSVTMWYHFAFVAVSVALFGMTVGALIVHLAPDRFREADVKRHLWRFSLAFGVSIAISFITQLSIPFLPRWSLIGVYSVILTCLVISVPFIFSGIVVCLSLTRFPSHVNRLYGADLVGAALGCVGVVLVLNQIDGPSTVIAIGALASVGALMFARDASSVRGSALALAAIVGLGGFALVNSQLAEHRHPFLRIVWAKELPEQKHLYEKWNSFSRVTVDLAATTRPFGWGMSATLPPDAHVNQLGLTIDGGASTVLTEYSGDPATTDFLRYDVTNLAHYIRPNSDVLVVGVGGGRDVLSALEFDQNSVTGVELNGVILDTVNGRYGDFTGHLDRHPKVTFVHDEARSYVTRSDKKYDIIQISLIDTWAATSAGAFALSENTLYTTEAWETFLDRLKPGGVLSLTRWYSIGGRTPLETYRMTALAARTLKDHGVEDPRRHMIVYQGPTPYFDSSVATLLVSPQPFEEADFSTLDTVARRLQFPAVLTPDIAADDHFAGLASPSGSDAVISDFSEDISPPTDNRPFFFQMVKLRSFFDGAAFNDTHVMRPALVLGMLGIAVLGLTACCVVLPLLVKTRRSAHEGMLPFYTYFSGIGLGFLLVEISQLQRLSIFLGHPTYALTVVLFSVLLASGMGSMLSERIVRDGRPATLLIPLCVLMAGLIAFGFATPTVIDYMDSETTPVRIATAVGLLMPLGLVMGMPFPIGMSVASTRSGAPTAFLWGINGAMSVCASVLGIVVALLWGIATAFWLGALCYAVAVASLAVVTLRADKPVTIEAHGLQQETSR